jgi:hypothetical protein
VKGLKPTLVSILAIGLLAGSAMGVAAQDEVGAGPESATFTIDFNFSAPTEVIVDEASGLETLVDMPFRATDPRAAGLLTVILAEGDLTGDGLRSQYIKEGLRLVNDGGAWVGTGHRFMVYEKDQRTKKQKQKGRGRAPLKAYGRFMELTGEGGYELRLRPASCPIATSRQPQPVATWGAEVSPQGQDGSRAAVVHKVSADCPRNAL